MQEFASNLMLYFVFLASTSLHEASHAFLGRKGGDTTAADEGLDTIDPIPHIKREPFGMVLMPILTLITIGWPLGFAHVPYNRFWARNNEGWAALMSLAGPVSNLMLALIAALLLRIGMEADVFFVPDRVNLMSLVQGQEGTIWSGLAKVLLMIFSLNLILGLFNLLPLPPLDGSGIVPYFLPPQAASIYEEILAKPYTSMLGIIIAWKVFDPILIKLLPLTMDILYFGYF